jgi:hypothetical protein
MLKPQTFAPIVKQDSKITLDFCLWLHRNADSIVASLNSGEMVAAPAPAPVVRAAAAAVGKRAACALCDLPIHGHGLCRMHYGRMKRAERKQAGQ